MDLGVLKIEYTDNKFEESFDSLYSRYKQVRRLRRDGNCFYRAFLFQLFEHFICSKGEAYTSFLKVVEDSKDDLVANGGYDLIAIEDFYDVFMDSLKGLKEVKPEDAVAHCMK
jgi:ubiquitin thioesterase protein OTUB1